MRRRVAFLGLAWTLMAISASIFGAACRARPTSAKPTAEIEASEISAQRQTAVAVATTESESVPRSLESPCDATIREGQHRGMCYAHTWQNRGARGYGSDVSRVSLEELAELGVDWVSLTPFGWQPSLTSTEVRTVASRAAETDDRLRRAVETAHTLGLSVMMKPHIWISYSEWRGNIDPQGREGWDRWFDSYEAFILHYAQLSEDIRADMLVVGVELASSTIHHPDRWRALIARVREVYSGPLVYAANWDEVEQVTFWDALDYIGVQMFAPLAESPYATPDEMRVVARAWRERYRVVSERFSRPVILTEVGYKSIVGGAITPNIWPEHLPAATEVDQQTQADAYCVVLEEFGQADFVAGVYWWKWFTDPSSDEEGPDGFSPRGKLAEDVLRQVYSASMRSATPP